MRKGNPYGFGLLLFLMFEFILTSCIDPIAFNTDDSTNQLVIFGSFTNQYKDHEVTLRRTGKFGNNGIAVPGALVEIIDEEFSKAQYYESGEGIYILPKGAMESVPGRSYKLSVTLSNEAYESSWENMPESVAIENTYFDIDFRKELSASDHLIQQFFIDVFIDAPLKTSSGNKAFLRWEVDETYSLTDLSCGSLDPITVCYFQVPGTFGQLNIFKATDDSQLSLRKYQVYSRHPAPYLQFNELHYFNVSQYSISETTYDYWEKINIVSNPTGSIFDKVPAGVAGNLNAVDQGEEVLGYFEVASVSVDRTVTTWQDVNASIQIPQECSIFIPFYFQPDYCCYCFILPNTIPKPDYWGDR